MEKETVTGFTYTHFDCPECGEALEREGDFTGETECDACNHVFVVD